MSHVACESKICPTVRASMPRKLVAIRCAVIMPGLLTHLMQELNVDTVVVLGADVQEFILWGPYGAVWNKW